MAARMAAMAQSALPQRWTRQAPLPARRHPPCRQQPQALAGGAPRSSTRPWRGCARPRAGGTAHSSPPSATTVPPPCHPHPRCHRHRPRHRPASAAAASRRNPSRARALRAGPRQRRRFPRLRRQLRQPASWSPQATGRMRPQAQPGTRRAALRRTAALVTNHTALRSHRASAEPPPPSARLNPAPSPFAFGFPSRVNTQS